jgi:hypothetical protein
MHAVHKPCRQAAASVRTIAGLILFIAIAVALDAPSARADLYDSQTVLNITGSAQTSLNVVLSGNVTSADINETNNPFGPGGAVTYNYDAGSNSTTVTFTGPNSIANNASATYGLSFHTTNSFEILAGYWSDTEATDDLFPVLSITAAPMYLTGPVYYGFFYTQINFAADDPADPNEEDDPSEVYEELPLPGGCGEFTASDTEAPGPYDTTDLGGGTLSTIDSAVGGTWGWDVDLDELNQDDTPVPGPWFWPVPDPNHTLLNDGEEADDSFSEDVYATPLPAPFTAGAALILLVGVKQLCDLKKENA